MDIKVQEIEIGDYRYELPDERIAKFPLKERDASKLLIYRHGQITEDVFRSLPGYLESGELMVFNNTRVIQARLHFRRGTRDIYEGEAGGTCGALIEVFLLEPFMPHDYQQIFLERERCSWLCMIGNLKRWKDDVLEREISVGGRKVSLSAVRGEAVGTSVKVEFTWNDSSVSFAEILEAVGEIPVPPYLNRKSEESDKTTYQTVYSKIKGSVAAPTAGLHFTDRVLADLQARGVEREELTLHVGAGTFRPVKSEQIGGHQMHSEYVAVNRRTIERLLAHDGHVVAVGTTSVRTLESLYYIGVYLSDHPDASDIHVEQWAPYDNPADMPVTDSLSHILDYLDRHSMEVLKASTQIIIVPGYRFKVVSKMVTNFHQPESTLLLLVSAFVNGDWTRIYDYALENGFRFLSYGDSSLLIP